MLGWLHATPEDRTEARVTTEPNWPLPDCGQGEYIASWFGELGLNFGFVDVKAWADLTGCYPEPWEVDSLISMSSEYTRSVNIYRKKSYNLAPPFDGRGAAQRGAEVEAKFMAAFARQQNGN